MTPLHYDLLTAPGAEPERWVLFCHGILGRGSNWRGFARRLLEEAPRHGAILVDLRAHGRSRSVPPPDSLQAAARDLWPIMDAHHVTAVAGHSFGGKVAIELAQRMAQVERSLDHLFVLDSLPAARPERQGSAMTTRVVKMLATLPAHFLDRAAFHRYVEELGFSRELARWLGQNLDPLEDGYELGLDVSRIEVLLESFFARELWPALDPPGGTTTAHLVIAGRSSVFAEADRERAWDLAARTEQVHVHVLEAADHWLHIDDPDGLLNILAEALA